jgi:hypothetical protein
VQGLEQSVLAAVFVVCALPVARDDAACAREWV